MSIVHQHTDSRHNCLKGFACGVDKVFGYINFPMASIDCIRTNLVMRTRSRYVYLCAVIFVWDMHWLAIGSQDQRQYVYVEIQSQIY